MSCVLRLSPGEQASALALSREQAERPKQSGAWLSCTQASVHCKTPRARQGQRADKGATFWTGK